MRSRRPYVASILAATLLLASLSVGSTAERKARQQSGPAALFVVYGTQPANAYMVPFVIIEGGQFKQPIAGDSDADEISRFTDAYYSSGKKYRVLFGGGEAGSLTVRHALAKIDGDWALVPPKSSTSRRTRPRRARRRHALRRRHPGIHPKHSPSVALGNRVPRFPGEKTVQRWNWWSPARPVATSITTCMPGLEIGSRFPNRRRLARSRLRPAP